MSNENNVENEKIIERTVASEMKKSYMDYAMSVIISRALPDARDGLKPEEYYTQCMKKVFYHQKVM